MKTKQFHKKYKFLILLFFLLLIISVFYVVYPQNKQKQSIEKPSKTNNIIIPARPSTFADGANKFIKVLKLARIATLKKDSKKASTYSNQAFILWRDIVNEFINTPPDKSTTNKWTENLSKTFELIQEANILAQKTKLEALGEKLDESKQYLNSFFTKNKNQMDDKLFTLLLSVKKLSQTQNLKEAKKYIPQLKINYTNIKELDNSPEFKKLCNNFEDVLSALDNATEATFKRAQTKLLPAFIAIYEKY